MKTVEQRIAEAESAEELQAILAAEAHRETKPRPLTVAELELAKKKALQAQDLDELQDAIGDVLEVSNDQGGRQGVRSGHTNYNLNTQKAVQQQREDRQRVLDKVASDELKHAEPSQHQNPFRKDNRTFLRDRVQRQLEREALKGMPTQ